VKHFHKNDQHLTNR